MIFGYFDYFHVQQRQLFPDWIEINTANYRHNGHLSCIFISLFRSHAITKFWSMTISVKSPNLYDEQWRLASKMSIWTFCWTGAWGAAQAASEPLRVPDGT